MSNVFDNLTKINGFQIVSSNPRGGRFSHEPYDGTIQYGGKIYYFKFNHEFDSGNTYIVYENDAPVSYFFLYPDINSEDIENSPMISEEEYKKYDEYD